MLGQPCCYIQCLVVCVVTCLIFLLVVLMWCCFVWPCCSLRVSADDVVNIGHIIVSVVGASVRMCFFVLPLLHVWFVLFSCIDPTTHEFREKLNNKNVTNVSASSNAT